MKTILIDFHDHECIVKQYDGDHHMNVGDYVKINDEGDILVYEIKNIWHEFVNNTYEKVVYIEFKYQC